MKTMSSHENVILEGIRAISKDGIHVSRSQFYADAAQYLTTGTHCLYKPILPGMGEHAREVLIRLSELAAYSELHRPTYRAR